VSFAVPLNHIGHGTRRIKGTLLGQFTLVSTQETKVALRLREAMPEPSKLIIKAAKNGDAETLKALLNQDYSLIDARDSDGSTPLHCATWKGHVNVVAVLLDAGANVNAVNQNEHWGTTPLHAAAHANQTAIAKMLLDAGADTKAKDNEGRTPMFHTTFHKAKAVAKLLLPFEE
jgi:ankyrin repeat protein